MKPWPAQFENVRNRLEKALLAGGVKPEVVERILDRTLDTHPAEFLAQLAKRKDPEGKWYRTAAEGLLRIENAPPAPAIQRAPGIVA